MTTQFGRELRRLRVSAGKSLNDLSQGAHFDKGYLSRVETGKRSPSVSLARACDKALATGGQLTRLLLSGDEIATVPDVDDEDDDPLIPGPVTAHHTLLEVPFAALLAQTRVIGQRSPAYMVLEMVRAQITTIQELVETDTTGNGLQLILARHMEYAGWLTQETGDHREARRWTAEAGRLANRCGNAVLSAYVRVRHAELSLASGDARGALAYAESVSADPAASSLTKRLAAQREAQAHAMVFDKDRAMDALARAGREGNERTTDVDGSVLGSSTITDGLAITTGWSMYDLSEHDNAAAHLETGIAAIPEGSYRVRSIFMGRLARVYLAAGHVDQACEAGHEALRLARLTDSASAGSQLRELSRSLLRVPRHRGAANLFTELTTTGVPRYRQPGAGSFRHPKR